MGYSKVSYFKHKSIEGLEIFNCQDVDFCFPPHLHKDYCIWFNPFSGENIIQNGENKILYPGSFGVIHPGEMHANNRCKDKRRALKTFYLSPNKLKYEIRRNLNISELKSEIKTDFFKSKEFIRLLLCLEYSLHQPKSNLESETIFLEIIVSLCKICKVNSVEKKCGYLEDARVKKVKELFHSFLGTSISINDIAKILSCSPYYFIRFFKKATGLTPHSYLIQLRLERAKELISHGSGIADAALQTGFNDQSHLYKYFKCRYGLTPKSYQDQIS